MKITSIIKSVTLASAAIMTADSVYAQASKTYTIPVIIHVISSTANATTVKNQMTTKRIKAALDRTNALVQGSVTAGTLDGFGALQGRGDIAFVLATKKNDGTATTGIEYLTDDYYGVNGANDIPGLTNKYQNQSTSNWPTSKYLNIYILESLSAGTGSSGIAWMPSEKSANPEYNAVLLNYLSVGGVGDATQTPSWANYEGNMAHELGHAMNLKHTFGHNGNTGSYCGDDGIADTPITDGQSEWSNTVPATHYTPAGMTGCGSSHATNVENVMDYSRKQTMFTAGQITAATNSLKSTTWNRNSLWTDANLIATGVKTGTIVSSPISNNVPVTGLSIGDGGQKLFTLTIPAGATSASFNTSGGTGDVDLYVQSGSAPTTQSSAYASSNGPTTTESVTINNPAAGTYYILLDGYAGSGGASGFQLVAKYSTSTSTAITNGVAVTGIASAIGTNKVYSITVPAGRPSLKIETSGGSGDADLYAQLNSAPTTTTSSYKSGNGPTTSEIITINNPAAGTYYILVNAYGAFSGVSLKATY